MARTKQAAAAASKSQKQPRQGELVASKLKLKAAVKGSAAVDEKKDRHWHAGTVRMRRMRWLNKHAATGHVLPLARIQRTLRGALATSRVTRIKRGSLELIREIVESSVIRVVRDASQRADDGTHITMLPRHVNAAVVRFVRDAKGYIPRQDSWDQSPFLWMNAI